MSTSVTLNINDREVVLKKSPPIRAIRMSTHIRGLMAMLADMDEAREKAGADEAANAEDFAFYAVMAGGLKAEAIEEIFSAALEDVRVTGHDGKPKPVHNNNQLRDEVFSDFEHVVRLVAAVAELNFRAAAKKLGPATERIIKLKAGAGNDEDDTPSDSDA